MAPRRIEFSSKTVLCEVRREPCERPQSAAARAQQRRKDAARHGSTGYMVDKRFWSGAILLVTIVVAGASSLPTLLLRPAAPEPVPVVPSPIAKTNVPAPVRAEAEPIAMAEPLPAASTLPIAVAEPALAPAVQASAPQSVPAAEAAHLAHAQEVAPIVFPPVQPVGIPALPAPEVAASAASSAASAQVAPREKAARGGRRQQHAMTPKPNAVRPAPYPIREFFAWRR